MKGSRQIKKYVAMGLTFVLSAIALIIFYDSVFANHTLVNFIKKLLRTLLPILYGCVMAYLLLPFVNTLDKAFRRIAEKAGMKQRKNLFRFLSVLGSWFFVFVICYAFVSVALPQIVGSVNELSSNIEAYYQQVYDWANGILEKNSEAAAWVLNLINQFYEELADWLRESVLPQATVVVGMVGNGIIGFCRFVLNFLIGIIVSFYLLMAKESWSAAAKRLVTANFTEEHCALIFRGTRRTDAIFSGYIRGSLIDSLIVGILCLLACQILKIPYAPIVSLLVGVTNIIPFFGPFLGAIPSGLLILIVSPAKCLTFVIMILILQQIDGNILKPWIVGGSTGLAGLWVLVSILVGGAFFGVAGMFFGVPVFSCIHDLINWCTEEKLSEKKLPTELAEYRKEK